MFPITRLYASEDAAHAAIAKVVELEVSPDVVTVVNPNVEDAAAAVDALIDAGKARSGHRYALRKALANGRTIVSVLPEWGMGSAVENTLENNGAVDSDTIRDYNKSSPTPFSDFFGLPVLIKSKSHTELIKFDSDSSFGLDLISRKATPLSSLFGIKLLSKHKSARGTSIEKMSSQPAWLSSKIGLKLLSKHKSARGTSIERLSSRGTLFSGFLGLPVLTKRKK
ncbi:MAG: hypothetical protein AAFN78_00130 [Pseudomonadota bacterium]